MGSGTTGATAACDRVAPPSAHIEGEKMGRTEGLRRPEGRKRGLGFDGALED
jgi:hypothetical protein